MSTIASPIACKNNNVFIHVSDHKKSVEWYCDLLGVPFNKDHVESSFYKILVTSETGPTLNDHTFDPGFTLYLRYFSDTK